MVACNAEEGEGWTLPRLVDLLKLGAKDKNEAYTDFLTNYIQGAIGKMKYRRGAATELTSVMCTSSTEAFALLVLENNWQYWKADVAAKRDKTENIEKQKYTGRTGTDGTMMGGWSKEGINRFIEIHELVKKDRQHKKRQDLEKNILQYQKEQELEAAASKKGKKRSRLESEQPPSHAQEQARWMQMVGE